MMGLGCRSSVVFGRALNQQDDGENEQSPHTHSLLSNTPPSKTPGHSESINDGSKICRRLRGLIANQKRDMSQTRPQYFPCFLDVSHPP
ncbi:hypothetical protein CEP52_017628 [Fusarium oligoseptatum]|uniref:Uncharacterized protein n=1 Tax=Fusarium oligoseptatum TaxID=2604345 RepID=A0A428RLR8_9HYPO|nr:hypothetical protein CEP52_017628 [Fusarium oligoseptatum]